MKLFLIWLIAILIAPAVLHLIPLDPTRQYQGEKDMEDAVLTLLIDGVITIGFIIYALVKS